MNTKKDRIQWLNILENFIKEKYANILIEKIRNHFNNKKILSVDEFNIYVEEIKLQLQKEYEKDKHQVMNEIDEKK
jgi:hypothetical protein